MGYIVTVIEHTCVEQHQVAVNLLSVLLCLLIKFCVTAVSTPMADRLEVDVTL
jgi:hypothetical protein